MSANLIDGKQFAAAFRARIGEAVRELSGCTNRESDDSRSTRSGITAVSRSGRQFCAREERQVPQAALSPAAFSCCPG